MKKKSFRGLFASIFLTSLILLGSFTPVLAANRQQNPTIQYTDTLITASYTQKDTDTVIRKTGTGTAVTITLLPVARTSFKGQLLWIVGPSDAATYNVTIDGNGSETINGATTKTISKAYGSVLLKNNGTTWDILVDNSTLNATDSLSVHLAGTETVTGNKTFSGTNAFTGETTLDDFNLKDVTTTTYDLIVKTDDTGTAKTADRTLTLRTRNADRVFDLGANLTVTGATTLNQDLSTSASPSFVVATVGDGAVGAPSIAVGSSNKGLYEISTNQLGISVAGQLDSWFDTSGLNTVGVKPYSEPGTVNTGVTASTFGDGKNFTTILTISQADAVTVADNAALADGYLLYTLPAGPIILKAAYMSMGLTLAEDTTATADAGIGTTIGSGANATLDAVAAGAENILTGQTMNNATGTAEVKTVVNQPIAIEAADSHLIYFNVADTWADTAGSDLNGDIAGTVTIHWSKMN